VVPLSIERNPPYLVMGGRTWWETDVTGKGVAVRFGQRT
jgi:hypothetical protein